MQISSMFGNYSVENPLNLESIANKKISTDKAEDVNKVKFSNILIDTIQGVNQSQITSNEKIEALISGEGNVNMHDVMISLQESQMSMQLLIEVRNKLYDCYQQLNSVNL